MFTLENEYKSLYPEMHMGLTKRPALSVTYCKKKKKKKKKTYDTSIEYDVNIANLSSHLDI